jgi:hypothetical protein
MIPGPIGMLNVQQPVLHQIQQDDKAVLNKVAGTNLRPSHTHTPLCKWK